jgi:outer membrane protein
MNRTSTILSSLALLGVIVLFILHFSSRKGESGKTASSSSAPSPGGLRVAYVDIDTFEANYESLKSKKAEFAAQQAGMEAELQRSAEQFKADYASLSRRSQAGTISQAEGEAAEKRLIQMQQTLKSREQSMSTQFQEKLEAFNTELHGRMDDFLTDYTKEHHYDYVLSYSRVSPTFLYGNKSLDITRDVIKGMNERAASPNSKDSVKGK